MSAEFDILSPVEISAEQMAALLGTSILDIRQREAEGELFSIVRPERSAEQRYPVYQLAPEITPELQRRFGAMFNHEGSTRHLFLSGRDPDLAHLCVREVLCGKAKPHFHPDADAEWLLTQTSETRVGCVLEAAEHHKSIIEGW